MGQTHPGWPSMLTPTWAVKILLFLKKKKQKDFWSFSSFTWSLLLATPVVADAASGDRKT
jgi:hypothetical protein